MDMPSVDHVVAGFIMPHPPVIVPGVGAGPMLADQTVKALNQLAGELTRLQPETVVLISPHAPSFSDYIYFYDQDELIGDLSSFGAPQVRIAMKQDQDLFDQLQLNMNAAGLASGSLNAQQMKKFMAEEKLDHGSIVPLYFLRKAASFQLVVMASAGYPLPDLYKAGQVIRETAEKMGRKIVIVASGDQSHKVNLESPYGSVPEGPVYDRLVVEALQQGDLVKILSIEHGLRQKAAECGYRSMIMMCGAFAGRAVKGRVFSYEAPYGIGYCVASLEPDADRPGQVPDALSTALSRMRQKKEAGQNAASAPVRIARMALEHYVRTHQMCKTERFTEQFEAEPWLNGRAGVFVSLKKFGELRGCIGTTKPTATSIVDEIIQNAVSAGQHDPRFEPVTVEELADLTYSVDVLGVPEPVVSPKDLNPSVYGVIVQDGIHSGLLLPDLEGVDTVRDQLAIACRKAGIKPGQSYKIKRFRVDRYH